LLQLNYVHFNHPGITVETNAQALSQLDGFTKAESLAPAPELQPLSLQFSVVTISDALARKMGPHAAPAAGCIALRWFERDQQSSDF